MTTPNRAALLTKTHKVLKQQFPPVPPETRPLLEQLLFAACLENTPYPLAISVFERLRTSYFDWNEVRVSTVLELAEALKDLPHPQAAAANVKKILQNVFESTYSFDIETMKKQNLGQAVQRLEKMEGATPFVIAYATQHALEGHYIPLDRAALAALQILGVIDDHEAKEGNVRGLERTIPKNKGIEFAGLLHQLAADLYSNPQAPAVKKALLAIVPQLKDHYPKKSPKKEYEAAERARLEALRQEALERELAKQKAAEEAAAKEAAKEAAKREAAVKSAAAKAAKLAKAAAETAAKAVLKNKPEPAKPADKAKAKSPPPKPAKKPAAKPAAKKPTPKPAKPAAKKKSASKQLAKRKPR